LTVLFIFFLINFAFEIYYEIKFWFYKTIEINFDESESNFDYELPKIKEFRINEWCITYTKKNKNTFEFENPIMYFSHKKHSFEMILTKYFEIIKEINPKCIKWDFNLIDISDFLTYNIKDYSELLKDEEKEEITQEPIYENIENINQNDLTIKLLNQAQENYNN
jgi:hypothetical protein